MPPIASFQSKSRTPALGRGTIFFVVLDRDFPLGEGGLLGHSVKVDGHEFEVQSIEASAIPRDRYRRGEVIGLLAPFFVQG